MSFCNFIKVSGDENLLREEYLSDVVDLQTQVCESLQISDKQCSAIYWKRIRRHVNPDRYWGAAVGQRLRIGT